MYCVMYRDHFFNTSRRESLTNSSPVAPKQPQPTAFQVYGWKVAELRSTSGHTVHVLTARIRVYTMMVDFVCAV